jgi:hypothetical protein
MNITDPTELALLKEVYGCDSCASQKVGSQFTPAPSGSFFKFPPLIGGTGELKLLFVGYNPRRTTTNLAIHDFAMGSFKHFCVLSDNINHIGHRYIGSPLTAPDHEAHYDLHNNIVQRVFAKPFEDVAAVTEMYLCASKNGQQLPTWKSPCAKRHLMRTFKTADPDYMVTFGVGVPRFFKRFARGVRADVLHLPFPSTRNTLEPTMSAAVDWAVDSLIALEAGTQPPQKTWRWPNSDAILPQGVMRYP